jgi:hypothetical protein
MTKAERDTPPQAERLEKDRYSIGQRRSDFYVIESFDLAFQANAYAQQ